MSHLRGIDVSEHQGVIDWEKVKGQIDYAILRAGYGKNHIDRQFVRNISECNRLGIPCGAYWFSYALNADQAKAEADYCIEALKPYKVDYPVAFDFEYDSANYAKKQGVVLTPSLVQSMASVFLLEIEAAGYFAANYSNPDFINRYFGAALHQRFGLWLASWPKTVSDPAKPPQSCVMWQWGGAQYDGINGDVDSNYCYQAFPIARQSATEDTPVTPTSEPWYTAAQKWATENKIADGTRPDDTATRAEIWQMMYKMNGGK